MLNSRSNWRTFIVLTAGMMLCLPAVAEDAETEMQSRADVVSDLATAAQLIAFGRGELNETTGLSDFSSPESLVAAGGILLRIHQHTAGKFVPSDAKVLDENSQPLPDENLPFSLADEAAALFDEARAMQSNDKAGLEARIKQAQLVTDRGAVGGPRVISRTVKTGKAHTVDIEFEPNSPAVVTMRGTGKTQFEVVGPKGKVLWHSKGSWGTYQFHTGRGGAKNITVKINNKGGPPVAYTVTTN